jgi:type I restriction enzyme S subunit
MTAFHKVRLGEVLTLQRGFDITKTEQTEGDVPIVSSSGISSFHNKWKVQGPGVVIGRKGTLGTVHYLRQNYWPHDTTLWVKDFKGNTPRFLSYFLQTLKLENFDVGASNPTLNRNHVHKIKIIFPKDVDIQRKIAAILSAYDELIENNQRRIALLEKLAEEIYREWFVRLRFPGHEKVKVIKGVPQGWDVKRISEVVEFLSGYTFKSETYTPTGSFGIVTIKNVQDGYFVPECTDFVDAPPINMKAHCLLNLGDVLMSLTGNVGRVCHVFGSNLLLNQRVAKLQAKLKDGRQFIYYTFNNASMIQLVENLSLGSTAQMNLSPIQLGKQKLIVPSSELLQRFEEIVRLHTEQKLNLYCQNEKLKQTRDKLLPRLISGKLSVENLDIQFPPGMAEELNEALAAGSSANKN